MNTLLAMLRAGAARAGAAPALIERRGADWTPVSHARLAGAIDAAGAALSALGVGEGERAALWLPNGLDYLALQFAAAGLGAESLGINTRYGVFELEHLLAVAAPRVVALPGRFLDLDFASRLADAFAGARRIRADLAAPAILVCGTDPAELADPERFDLGGGVRRLDLGATAPPLADAGRPQAPAVYFTTSGSTGAPKLAGHDQASVAIHSAAIAEGFDMGPGDVVLGVLPFCGVFGFNAAMAALAGGASLLVEPVFEGGAVLDAMARFGVTHAFGGDDLWGRLHEAWRAAPVALPKLRRGGIAEFEGKALALAQWAREDLGAELVGLYGASELFAFMLARPLDDDLAAQVRAGGRPIAAGIEVRLGDPDTGAPTRAEQGEMQVRGYNRLTHYLGNPEATARALTADGWYRTGDLARDEGDGAFAFICRNSEALRLRGFLVEPAEIEQCLMAHPGVTGARVVGARTEAGDRPVAFVTLAADGPTTEALAAFCRSRLAGFKQPARIVALDAFPVTAGTNGAKIRLEALRSQAAALLAPDAA